MHGFDYSVPHFITSVRGMSIVVTLQIIADVLRVPRVEFLDYPGCDRLRTVSKDELISAFSECPSNWGEGQFIYCLGFAKGPWLLNMVMTFVLHPLSHYNSITEPHDWFLLSLIKGFTIDFPFHFILSIINVYRNTTTRDKLIFLSTITRLLRHLKVHFPSSDPIMGAIDAGTVKRIEAQFRSRHSSAAASPTPFTPSTFAPSSSTNGVTLKDIMAQLQCMDARLDTLSDELCQVNTRMGRIARRQTVMEGF